MPCRGGVCLDLDVLLPWRSNRQGMQATSQNDLLSSWHFCLALWKWIFRVGIVCKAGLWPCTKNHDEHLVYLRWISLVTLWGLCFHLRPIFVDFRQAQVEGTSEHWPLRAGRRSISALSEGWQWNDLSTCACEDFNNKNEGNKKDMLAKEIMDQVCYACISAVERDRWSFWV